MLQDYKQRPVQLILVVTKITIRIFTFTSKEYLLKISNCQVVAGNVWKTGRTWFNSLKLICLHSCCLHSWRWVPTPLCGATYPHEDSTFMIKVSWSRLGAVAFYLSTAAHVLPECRLPNTRHRTGQCSDTVHIPQTVLTLFLLFFRQILENTS